MTKPPPTFRPSRNATEKQKRDWDEKMRSWLADAIDHQQASEMSAVHEAFDKSRIAIGMARAGHPEWLRQLYPHFADCIHSPPLRPGKKRPKQKQFRLAKIAVQFARRIRALWQKQYGQKYRMHDEKSAEDFAIDIVREWFEHSAYAPEAAGLTANVVKDAAKPSGPSGRPKKKPRRKPRAK